MRGHKNELALFAIKEMQLFELVAEAQAGETGFFGHLAQGSLLQRFAFLDMTLGDGPATQAVLDHEDFDAFFGAAENDPAGGVFADCLDAAGAGSLIFLLGVWPGGPADSSSGS